MEEQRQIQTVANDLHKSLNFFIDKVNMEQNIKLTTNNLRYNDWFLTMTHRQ